MNNKTIKERLTIPTGKLKLIIDTDAKNEVDDQYAIAWAAKSVERFSVEAVYAAPFSQECFQQLPMSESSSGCNETLRVLNAKDGMLQSYAEIKYVYELLGKTIDGRVFYGSDRYIGTQGEAVVSDAALDLISRARGSKDILYIAACGVLTNIASAILLAPDIIEKIVVVWLGGQPLEFGHGIEFNLMQDVKATQIILNSKVPLVLIPCMNVASMLASSKEELRGNLAGKNPICDYLYEIVSAEFSSIDAEKRFMHTDRFGYLKGREDYTEAYLSRYETKYISWSRILWDIAIIAFLKNPNWVLTKYIPAPVLNDDLTWSIDESRHLIRIATYCWRNFIFGDMFYDLTKE